MGVLRYYVYGAIALVGYMLFLSSLRLDNYVTGVLFITMFSISQLIGLLLTSRIGSSNTLSVALSIGAVGSYIHIFNNSYVGDSLLGLGMGIYFMALISLMGVILGSSGLVNYIMYVYSGLFGIGLMVGALSSMLNNGLVFVAMTALMLALSFYLSLASINFKPSSLKLRYALTNQGMLIAAVLLSFSLPYMVSATVSLSKYWLGPLYVASVPLSIIPAYFMINKLGLRSSLVISIILTAASSILTYIFNNQYTLLMLASSSMLIYSVMLQLLGLITSPLLYMPTLAVAYGISTLLEIPVGLALGFSMISYLVVGVVTLFLMLLIKMVKEPMYQIPKTN